MIAKAMDKLHLRKTDHPDFPYVLERNFNFRAAGIHYKTRVDFCHRDRAFLSVKHDIFTLLEGYAHNGATCAPDYEWMMPGIGAHDALYQFHKCQHATWSKSFADRVMRDLNLHEAKNAWDRKLLVGTFHNALTIGGHYCWWRAGKDTYSFELTP